MKKIVKISKESGIPLVGHVAFGIIDMGSNILQVRPTSICTLNCMFCSTDAGPKSKYRVTEYVVDLGYLLEWVKEVVEFKEEKIDIFIDSVGDVMCYDKIVELVEGLKAIKNVEKVIIETNGVLLTKKNVDEFERVGLDKINLSVHSLDENLAKTLSGSENYNLKEILKLIEYIGKSKIKLLIACVWLPSINDEEVEKIILLSKKLKCEIGVQKYEIHKYGRKMKGVKAVTYWKFYKKLEEWEKKFGVKLKIGPKDFGIKKGKRLRALFRKGSIINVKVVAPGWIRGQMLGVKDNKVMSIVDCNVKEGNIIKVRVLEDKNNIYVTKKI